MSKERGLLNLCAVAFKARKICPFLLTEISELLAQPEPEPIAWLIINKVTGYRKQVAYKPANHDKEMWDILPMYLGNRIASALTDNNTQYLLDQVSRLRAENAMLKEKWLTKEDEEDTLEESGYNRSDWWVEMINKEKLTYEYFSEAEKLTYRR